MDAIRPTSIRADQWNTIADDVKAGRCKATFQSDEGYHIDLLREKREHLCFDYLLPIGSEIESGVIGLEPGDIITLEWQNKPDSEDAPGWKVNGFATEDEYLFAQSLGARDQEVVALEAENKRLQAELDAAKASLKRAEFKAESADRTAAFNEEKYCQRSDNFSMLFRAVAANAPHVWDMVKDQLIDMSPGERDKTMSWAMRYREQSLQLDAANQRASKYRTLLLRTFPIIKGMTIAIAYDDIFGTHVSTGGELP